MAGDTEVLILSNILYVELRITDSLTKILGDMSPKALIPSYSGVQVIDQVSVSTDVFNGAVFLESFQRAWHMLP